MYFLILHHVPQTPGTINQDVCRRPNQPRPIMEGQPPDLQRDQPTGTNHTQTGHMPAEASTTLPVTPHPRRPISGVPTDATMVDHTLWTCDGAPNGVSHHGHCGAMTNDHHQTNADGHRRINKDRPAEPSHRTTGWTPSVAGPHDSVAICCLVPTIGQAQH